MAFADLPKSRTGSSRTYLGPYIFDRVCIEYGIAHRLAKPYHPWTNGQAEPMNRTIKEATIKARRLAWTKSPEIFKINPRHLIPRAPNSCDSG